MADVTVLWQPELGRGDWALRGPDLQTRDDLVTAVLVSLFTDAAAQDGDVIPDGTGDRRGWWGSALLGAPLGSRLWLLERAKQTEATRLAAQDYAVQALQWLTANGIAAQVTVEASWIKPGWLALVVTIVQATGDRQVINIQWAWKGLAAA